MKPHLPLAVLAALMGCFVAQSADIPNDYQQISLQSESDLNAYTYNSSYSRYAFLLETDLAFTPSTIETWTDSSPLITGGNIIFATADGVAPAALGFYAAIGGAIYSRETFNINDNADVTFSGNYASSEGGAIVSLGTFNINNNVDVTFSDNHAAIGGAIESYGETFNINDNADVAFSGNYASSDGGAIESWGTFNINDNADVTFSGNYAGSDGGAIKSWETFNINNNTNVAFSGNIAHNYGGAIYSDGFININNNADVTFNENSADIGGAIYTTGNLLIAGNDSVTFEKNYERNNGYQLRSIYAVDNSISLAAKTGGHITFYDSIYVEDSRTTVSFNADYKDENGITQKAEGDIIFSGKYAETHLNEILFANNEGRTATREEIINSQTSYIGGDVSLHNGSLQVTEGTILNIEGSVSLLSGTIQVLDGASLNTEGMTLNNYNDASILLRNATLGAELSNITFGYESSLQLYGSNTITANNLVLKYSTLSFALTDKSTEAMLNHEGNLTIEGSLDINIDNIDDVTGYNYKLMTVSGIISGWDLEKITLNGKYNADDLFWKDNELYLFYKYKNGSISFTESQGYVDVRNYEDVSFQVGTGRAISSSDGIKIIDNGTVSFVENTSIQYGGAIYSDVYVDINNNEDVIFSGNTTEGWGGAIYSYDGGADIYSNEEVSFSGNTAGRFGGAICSYGGGRVNIYDNTEFTFSGNIADYDGGAIYSDGTLNINNNTKVTFSGNIAHNYGGAIYSDGVININNNTDVTFSGNTADWSGGAIHTSGNLSIVGNDSVTFEKNYVTNGGLLRSIVVNPYASENCLVLAAKTGGNITFYDSVYMRNYSDATVSLNADYVDDNWITQKAEGDIIFSGRYTEDHLKEVKGGVEGTAMEIENSRTSELLNTVNLYGGTLRVEDKAVLKTHALNLMEESNATLRISDGKVDADTYDVIVNGTGTVEFTGAEGCSQLTARNLYIEKNGTLRVEDVVTMSVVDEVIPDENITIAAAEMEGIYNEKLGGIINGNIDLAAGANFQADGAHLSITSGTLTFNSTATDKINLILTLGAEYNDDSKVLLFTDVSTVKFAQDNNITTYLASQSITLNAIDYFAGEWINENTQLIYEGGNVYLTGVNRVIPEPTTATLSLFALAGLAMRRRRRK